MALIRINKNPSDRQLLVFGFAWLFFMGIFGMTSWLHGRRHAAEVAGVLAVALPVSGLLFRKILRYAYLGLSYFTFPVGFIVSYIVLAGVYYVVLTPIGLSLRLFGTDPLTRRFDPAASSYWQKREHLKTMESYLNQR